jgi:hypothetical protein
VVVVVPAMLIVTVIVMLITDRLVVRNAHQPVKKSRHSVFQFGRRMSAPRFESFSQRSRRRLLRRSYYFLDVSHVTSTKMRCQVHSSLWQLLGIDGCYFSLRTFHLGRNTRERLESAAVGHHAGGRFR